MTADDPRVQRARAFADTPIPHVANPFKTQEAVCDLPAVVDELAAALVDSHRRHLHTILRAEAAEAERDRLLEAWLETTEQ